MVHSVGGASPVPEMPNVGNNVPPPPALSQAIDAFWCLFNTQNPQHLYLDPANYNFANPTPQTDHWLNMFVSITNTLITQIKDNIVSPNPIPQASAIWQYLTTSFPIDKSGDTGSLYTILTGANPTQSLLYAFNNPPITGSGIKDVLHSLDNGSSGCVLASWYYNYPFSASDSQSLFGYFQILEGALETASSSSATDPSWDNVVTAILNLDKALKSGTPDGMNVFLQTYLESSFTSTAGQSLVDLATAINTAGGVAKDATDAQSLFQLFLPSGSAQPFPNEGAFADFMTNGWIGSILYGLDNPYAPPH